MGPLTAGSGTLEYREMAFPTTTVWVVSEWVEQLLENRCWAKN